MEDIAPTPAQPPDGAEVREFIVATWAVGSVEAAVRSLARAARRAGLSPEPSLVVDWSTKAERKQTRNETAIHDGEVTSESSSVAVVPVVTCRITLPGGSAAAHGDWRVLAALQRVDGDAAHSEITNDIFTAPKDLPRAEAWRHAPLHCEHCSARRTRTKTLVLEEKGTLKTRQVGKECAANYLGDRLEQAIGELEFQEFVGKILTDFEPGEGGFYGGGGGGGRTLTAWDAEEFMSHAIACVRERGWQPSKIKVTGGRYGDEDRWEINEDATAAHVKDVLLNGSLRVSEADRMAKEIEATQGNLDAALTPIPDASAVLKETMERIAEDSRKRIERLTGERAALLRPPYTVTEADRLEATKVVDWLASQTPDPEKDKYLSELQAIFSAGFISEKRIGFAVSAVRAQMNAERAAAMKAKSAASEFVGTEGKREEFNVKLVGIYPYGGAFPGNAYRLEDPDGNQLTLMSSSYPFPGDMSSDDAVGKEYLIKATVKSHEIYRETKTTMLSRVKVLRELNGEMLPLAAPVAPAQAMAVEPSA